MLVVICSGTKGSLSETAGKQITLLLHNKFYFVLLVKMTVMGALHHLFRNGFHSCHEADLKKQDIEVKI